MTDTALKQAIKEAYASAPNTGVILHTLELYHPAFTVPIRVVRDHAHLTATLEASAPRDAGASVQFVRYNFDLTPPEVSASGNPQCVIEIDNVSREILANVEAAMATTEMITVIYRAYLSTDPSGPQNDPPLALTILAISVPNMFRIRATAGFTDVANRKFPADEYTAEIYPGLLAQ